MCRQFQIKGIGSFEIPQRSNTVYIVGVDTYLGGHLAKSFLDSGIRVFGCGDSHILPGVLSNVKYTVTDYSGNWDFIAVDKYDWIIICHDPRKGRKCHLLVIESLVEYLRTKNMGTRLCYPSSSSICKEVHGKITEESPLCPRSELGLTIASAEIFLQSIAYSRISPLYSYILRFGDIYGDNIGLSNLPGLVNHYIEEAQQKRVVSMYGLGLEQKTITNVQDVCRLTLQYLNLDFQPKLINLPGEKITIAEITAIIAKKFGVEIQQIPLQISDDIFDPYGGNQVLSVREIKSVMKYRLNIKFEPWVHRYAS